MVKTTLSRLVLVSLFFVSCFGGSFFGAYYGSATRDANATPMSESVNPKNETVVQYSTQCYWPTDEDMAKITGDAEADRIPMIVIPTPEELGINPKSGK